MSNDIRNLIDPEAFEKLHQTDRDTLGVHFAMGSFQRFCEAQITSIQNEISALDPYKFEKPEQFHELAKSFKLVWRFWSDLKGFAEDKATVLDQPPIRIK